MDTGIPIALGVNLVMSTKCSVAHVEIVAISLAQQLLGTPDLGADGQPPTQLVSSAEPGAMCLGAAIWSGIRCLACGARDADVRAIGFDEGPKPSDWPTALEARGIAVIRDVRRREAVQVLHAYAASGGVIYNGRQGRASP
jgi:tRNA(Arg) A34 adenosine deaminase TadA